MVYDNEEAGNDELHIIDIDNNNAKMTVKGFSIGNDGNFIIDLNLIVLSLAYKNDKVFALTRYEVRFATLSSSLFGQADPIELKPDLIRTIKPGCPMHCILINDFSR